MASAELVFARRPGWTYGDSPPLDFGQVFELTGQRNDSRLLDLGLVARVEKGTAIVGCGRCGARFATDRDLNMHGGKRHKGVTAVQLDEEGYYPKAPEDVEAEKELKEAETRAPLHMDRTKASRTASAGIPEINTKRRDGAKKKRTRQGRRRATHGS
jgi:hypothetical protein